MKKVKLQIYQNCYYSSYSTKILKNLIKDYKFNKFLDQDNWFLQYCSLNAGTRITTLFFNWTNLHIIVALHLTINQQKIKIDNIANAN